MQKKRRIKREQRRRKARFVAFIVVFLFLVLVISGAAYASFIIKQLPPLEQFSSRKVSESTKIYDRTGEVLLYEIFGEEKRTVIPFEQIPDTLKQATLATEDANFYTQPAFDWKAIIRAFLVNLREGKVVQGGSTITQQLVKNVFLTSERTITRKIKELVLAIELESRYGKDEIFSAYLNQIPYGSNAYGVEAASQTYFNKPAVDITLSEATLLASLPKAPSYYSPWGNHIDELFERKDYILERMYELGYINEEERDEAKETELAFAPASLGAIKAPHFSLAVKQYLVNRYGEETVLSGGLRVITTLDWELQQIAEEIILKGAKRNEELYSGKNAALVAQDATTGNILAMVGSRDYFDDEIDGNFNVATQGLRQPGSALKPFVYLTAFKKGFYPESKIFDVPTEFVAGDPNCPVIITELSEQNDDCFNPDNFDNMFKGAVSFEKGLAQSINVPSVKILHLAGFDNVLKTLSEFGITTLKERWRYGLSLVLGGGEVKLIELINAYATLAQEGVRHTQTLILRVEKNGGEVLEEHSGEPRRVFDNQPIRIVNQILSDKELRSGLFQNSLGLTVFPGKEVALKTGTTDDYRDAWAIGYTPSFVVGVWAGNNDNSPMHQRGSSILAAVPIWSEFMNSMFEKKSFPPEVFIRPDPQPAVNKPMLNGEVMFSPVVNEETLPQIHSILYWTDKKDSQFYNWEQAVVDWARKHIPNFHEYNKPLPENISFTNTAVFNDTEIQYIKPGNGEFVQPPLVVQATTRSIYGLKSIELYFNRELLQVLNIKGDAYNYMYYINKPLKAQNLIELRVTDTKNNKTSSSLVVFTK